MVMIGLNAKSDEIFITFIDTEYQKSADELDKINKPTELRMIKE